jgi:repressor LexA
MMNERARGILQYIQQSVREHGRPPTIREIGSAFGISSTNGVRYYLNLLVRDGHLKKSGRISRGITVPGAIAAVARRAAGIPILGRAAAGQPILAEQNFEGTLEPQAIFGDPSRLFALRVRGDSMVDAGILDGDYVVVRHQERATAGEIVVALLEDEATVKYYRPRSGRVELVPANPNYDPIPVGPESGFRIVGVVTGVLRTVGR